MAFYDTQVNTYVEDVDPVVDFWTRRLGFRETYRTPTEGPPEHVEVRLGGLVMGFATVKAAREHHNLDVSATEKGFEVVLWSDDVRGDYARLLEAGATSLEEPHLFIGYLLGAWLRDPWGHTIHIVQDMRGNPGSGEG